MRAFGFVGGIAGLAAALAIPACSSADQTIVGLVGQQTVPPSEIRDNVSAQFSIDGRQLTVTMRTDAPIPPPTGATVSFPVGMFNGFTDGGIKTFLGIAGMYTESASRGAPLFWVNATQAFFNLPRAAQFAVNSGTLTITPTGNPLPAIPAGVYTMNFLTGVFSLDAGIYDVAANISFPGASVTLNKLLLIRSQVIPHFGVSALADLELVTRLVLNNPNGDSNQVRARFFDQSGNPLDVRLDGATTSNTVLEVPGQSSLQSQLEAAGDGTSVGWILLTSESNLPFRSAVVFTDNSPAAAAMATSVNGNRLRTEAGISSSELDTRHVLRVTASQDGVNTAFAIANPTEADAHLRLLLKPDSGEEISAEPLTLPAHNQTAQFVTEFFGLPAATDLEGRLLIYSDTDVGITSLETLNGEPFASLPSGTPGED